MNPIVNFEDPLSEFEMNFLDLFSDSSSAENQSTTAQDIANDTPSLFLNPNTAIDFDITNWASSAESTTTSLQNSPLNNFKQLNSKNTLLASPLQDYNEIYPPMSNTWLDKKHGKKSDSDGFIYDYTTNKPSNRYRVSKPSSSSPLIRPPLKPSVTIANIDTLSRLEIKSSKSAIPKTNVGNPFYKPPTETKPKMTSTKNNIPNGNEGEKVESDGDGNQVIYDLLADNNISNITSQYPVLETEFKTFDDHLIFDALLDNSQQPQHSQHTLKDNIPWRV